MLSRFLVFDVASRRITNPFRAVEDLEKVGDDVEEMSYEEATRTPVAVRKRQPLSTMSANEVRPMSNGTLARNIIGRSALPSLVVYRQPASGPVPLLELPVRGRIPLTADRSDSFWLQNALTIFGGELNLDEEWGDIQRGPARMVYPDNYEWPGSQDWDSSEMYGVPRGQMVGLLNGAIRDFELFLMAEGQLVRVMMAVADHPLRLEVLQAWMILVGRYCGYEAVAPTKLNWESMKSTQHRWGNCTFKMKTAFDSLDEFTALNLRQAAQWKVAFLNMKNAREDYFGPWSCEHWVCALHGYECVGFMEHAPLTWSDSESEGGSDSR